MGRYIYGKLKTEKKSNKKSNHQQKVPENPLNIPLLAQIGNKVKKKSPGLSVLIEKEKISIDWKKIPKE